MTEPIPWHQLFGLSWFDFFRGFPVQVELEMDLSKKKQLLDVVLIRKDVTPLLCRLPDGFEELAPHNLVSFKSFQEALDAWAPLELIAHYVNYRKQASPSMQELLPETDFRLFAVCVRFPQALARRVTLIPVQPGVYEVHHFTGVIRIIVVHELPQEEHNAMLHLFSARMEAVHYGAANHPLRSDETSTLLEQLFDRYRLEGIIMPDLLQQFHQEAMQRLLDNAPAEEILQRIKRSKLEELLKQLPTEELLKRLPTEELLNQLSVDELLAALSPEKRTALAERLKDVGK